MRAIIFALLVFVVFESTVSAQQRSSRNAVNSRQIHKEIADAWFFLNFGRPAASVPIGSFMKYPPPAGSYKSDYGGITYYYYMGVYFTEVPGGYVVSSPPAIIPQQVVIQESLPQQLEEKLKKK